MNAFSITNSFPELAESRRQLFEDSSVAIHEIDTEGIIRSVNQAECDLLGYAADELIGHPVWEFLAMECREASRSGIAKKVAREQPIAVFMREFRRADGSYLWVEIHENLIENLAGEVIGIRTGLFDITERRKFEMEIQKQHDRMKFLLRSWTRAILTADALGHVDFMNRAAETLTGWLQEEAIGLPLEKICRVRAESGEPVDLMSCLLAEQAICGVTRQSMIDRFGASVSVNCNTSTILNDDGVIVGAAVVLEKR
ncbi:MAG TPA: PAS domain S-box protein [Bryobacteraceae bacterium]|jgi:PAS domain S-box-containing protein|nr:PAS domain S-box protein [Bryobacteraceae bacterium]